MDQHLTHLQVVTGVDQYMFHSHIQVFNIQKTKLIKFLITYNKN